MKRDNVLTLSDWLLINGYQLWKFLEMGLLLYSSNPMSRLHTFSPSWWAGFNVSRCHCWRGWYPLNRRNGSHYQHQWSPGMMLAGFQ